MTYLFGNDETRPLSAVLPQTTSTDKFTQELRLVSPKSETFDWLIGGYYTNEDSEILQQILAVEAGTDTVATGIPILADVSLRVDVQGVRAVRQRHLARHAALRSVVRRAAPATTTRPRRSVSDGAAGRRTRAVPTR